MNQITTQYVTEGGACYEQYVITDPAAKTALTITPERGGMITGFTLDGDEYIWTRRPNFSECNRPRFGVPVLFPSCGNPDGGVHLFDGKAYPMECHGFADLCAWEVESVGPDGVTLIPVSRLSFGFGCGGGDYGKQATQMGAGAGAGVRVEPMAFLVVKDGVTRMLPVAAPAITTVDRAIELVPQVLDRVESFIDRKKAEKETY